MSQKTFLSNDERRSQRVSKGMEHKRRHKHIAQSLREFQKVGHQNDDPETYEDAYDDLYDDLYDDE